MVGQMGGLCYDLEERTFRFARSVASYCARIPRTSSNIEYSRQVIRATGSVGANYIEANEALGKKDFGMRIRISRKEAKESGYWLRLIVETNESIYGEEGKYLTKEANELRNILSSILSKVTGSGKG